MDEGATALRKQYVDSGKIGAEVFAHFEQADPTKTKKYLGWMLKQFVTGDYSMQPIATVINSFHEYTEKDKIDNKDINSYKTVEDVQAAVVAAYEKRTRSEIAVEAQTGADIVQKDDKWILVYVDSPEAMTYYAMGTKWCINDPGTFMDYVRDDEMTFYVAITKHDIELPPQEDMDEDEEDDEDYGYAAAAKFCIVITPNGGYVIYDATDDEIETGDMDGPNYVLFQMGNLGLDLSKLEWQDNQYMEEESEERRAMDLQAQADENYGETLDRVYLRVDGILDDIANGNMDSNYVIGEEATVEKIAQEIVDNELGIDSMDFEEGPYEPTTQEVIDAMEAMGYILIATDIETIKANIKDFEKSRATHDAGPGTSNFSQNIVDQWIDDIDNIVDLEIKSRDALEHMEPDQLIAYMKQLVAKWEEEYARKDVKGQMQLAFDSLQLKKQLSILWEHFV